MVIIYLFYLKFSDRCIRRTGLSPEHMLTSELPITATAAAVTVPDNPLKPANIKLFLKITTAFLAKVRQNVRMYLRVLKIKNKEINNNVLQLFDSSVFIFLPVREFWGHSIFFNYFIAHLGFIVSLTQ